MAADNPADTDLTYSREGDQNLQTIDRAQSFCDWMFSQVVPYLHGNILEVGSGRGTYSSRVLRAFPDSHIVLSDIDESYVQTLKEQFGADDRVSVVKLDLTQKADFAAIGHPVNSAFSLNVMEHIEDDVLAFNNIHDALDPGGTYVTLTPAHRWLYNCIDKAIDHYRRYDRKMMREKIARTPFRIERMFYFNFLSIAGWYVNGNIRKKSIINETAMGLFNKLVPMLRPIEKYILRQSIGLSLITVLRKD